MLAWTRIALVLPPLLAAILGTSLGTKVGQISTHQPKFAKGSPNEPCCPDSKLQKVITNSSNPGEPPTAPPPVKEGTRGRRDGTDRWRRSAGSTAGLRDTRNAALSETLKTNFWPTRGRRSDLGSLLGSVEKPFWAARGRRDPHDSAEDPFWATRGRRDPLDSAEDPFWATRGRRDALDSVEDPFWATRGKKLKLLSSGEEPFWAARGKKMAEVYDSSESPFWATRGEKIEPESEEGAFWAARGKKTFFALSGEEPFWAARGKKENSAEFEPFWSARGKKESSAEFEPFWAPRGKKTNSREFDPFWAARGKKTSAEFDPFWAARGKKQPATSGEEPFWAARGKRDTNSQNDKSNSNSKETTFWAARGRRSITPSKYAALLAETEPFWVSRGKRTNKDPSLSNMVQPRDSRQPTNDNFWPTRGKRILQHLASKPLSLMLPSSPSKLSEIIPEEWNPEDNEFWVELESRSQINNLKRNGDSTSVPEILAQILGIPTRASKKIKKEQIPKGYVVNPWYSTDFWASRG